jgi:hypothetical protein
LSSKAKDREDLETCPRQTGKLHAASCMESSG